MICNDGDPAGLQNPGYFAAYFRAASRVLDVMQEHERKNHIKGIVDESDMTGIVASKLDTVMNARQIEIALRRFEAVAIFLLPVVDANHRASPETFCRAYRKQTAPRAKIENRFIAAPADHAEDAPPYIELAPKRIGEHGGAKPKAQAAERQQRGADERDVEVPGIKRWK